MYINSRKLITSLYDIAKILHFKKFGISNDKMKNEKKINIYGHFSDPNNSNGDKLNDYPDQCNEQIYIHSIPAFSSANFWTTFIHGGSSTPFSWSDEVTFFFRNRLTCYQ